MKKIIKLIASFFYLGFTPFISGTIASCAGVFLYFLWKDNFLIYTVVMLVVTVLGFLVAAPAERIFQKKDSEKIVIDEVAGLLWAFWGLQLDFTLAFTGFFIFRALDAFKVYPANRLEKMKGSVGVMADDLVAGVYTNIVLQIITRVFM
jgi:phosphatidylglycerophosphatase A